MKSPALHKVGLSPLYFLLHSTEPCLLAHRAVPHCSMRTGKPHLKPGLQAEAKIPATSVAEARNRKFEDCQVTDGAQDQSWMWWFKQVKGGLGSSSEVECDKYMTDPRFHSQHYKRRGKVNFMYVKSQPPWVWWQCVQSKNSEGWSRSKKVTSLRQILAP